MSMNDLHTSKKLKATLFTLPKGMPLSTLHIKQLGISRQLVHRYVQSGWLVSLGNGYYLRAGDVLTREGAVAGLESQGMAVHIGGKSALSLAGAGHYLSLGNQKLVLYGVTRKKVPDWFSSRFPCELRMSQLFGEEAGLDTKLQVRRLDETDAYSPFISEPERALLEMLDDVPHKQSLDEAREIMESLFTLRADLVQRLLEACNRIKVKRLFCLLAEELKLPVTHQLDLSQMDFGANSVYIRTQKGKSLVLKHPGKAAHG